MSKQSNRSVLVNIDQEGFTDKICRNCKSRLSIEEVQVFIGKTNIDNIVCLNCYATVVEKRIKNRRASVNTDKSSVNKAKVDKATETVQNVEKESVRTNSVKTKSRRSERAEKIIVDSQHWRKKTDVTLFANASFNGGVFLNAIPGQSI